MLPQRLARLRSVIQEELSTLISKSIKDPRVGSLSITRVELTPDAGNATIYVSLLGSLRLTESEEEAEEQEAEIERCLEGLQSASGFLKRELGKILNIRQTPMLTFKADRGLANAMRVHELLKQVKPSTQNEGEIKPENDTE